MSDKSPITDIRVTQYYEDVFREAVFHGIAVSRYDIEFQRADDPTWHKVEIKRHVYKGEVSDTPPTGSKE